jgi:menaquinone C8-methyltransferase
MLFDSLLTAYIRRLSRRQLTFEAGPAATELPAPAADRRYLLYLHVPFCEVLCPFCSFHRVEFQRRRAQRYFQALRREIRHVTDAGYSFGELYVGGGTPTVMVDELSETISLLRELHPIERVSVETSPAHMEGDQLSMLRSAGVNRLSVGVQSFDDQLLREMQRYEKYGSSALIRQRLRNADGVFDTLNVDMIFNFPHQTEALLQKDLEILTDDIGVDQVSFYPLMLARSTRKFVERQMGPMNYGRERRFYNQIADHMRCAGYQRSSAWCFSRSKAMLDEYIAENEEYLGLGSGSFSYLGGTLYATTFSINRYLSLVEAGATGLVRNRRMSERDQMRYYLLMRLFGGSLDLPAAEARFGNRFQQSLRLDLIGLRMLGAITITDGHVTLTNSGYYLWVVMMREFFVGVNNFRDEMRQHISAERHLQPAA